MNCSPVLTADEFKTVHNTLCELRSVQQQLTGVINDRLAEQLQAVVRGFELGLKGAYDQDNRAFEDLSEHYEAVRQGAQLRSIWSIYSVRDLSQPHPYKDAAEICYRDHWGDQPVYETIPGPTWADLYAAADRCIQRSGDGHHIFIESFQPVAEQPHQLRLTTGS